MQQVLKTMDAILPDAKAAIPPTTFQVPQTVEHAMAQVTPTSTLLQEEDQQERDE
jgi:hypothetical protein